MAAKVADASVIAAVIFNEPNAEQALALLDGYDLYVPTLLAYELASIAKTKATRYPIRRIQILDALELGLAADLRWVDVDHSAVVRIALSTGLTTSDASYLHLARAMGIPLVTFDRKLRGVIGV